MATSQTSDSHEPANIDPITGEFLDPEPDPNSGSSNDAAVAGINLDEFGVDEADLVVAQREQVHLPIEKPGKSTYFRTHPTERGLYYLLKDDDGRFLLVPKRFADHPHLAGHVAPYEIVPTIDRSGHLRLWPIRRVRNGEPSNGAWDSALTIAERARHAWLRMEWSPALKAYDAYVAPFQPAAPVWPDDRIDVLVSRAFAERKVQSEQHPVIRRLLGVE
jgi:hypothetical protein